MKVCIGGTFDILHKGHKMLISKAYELAGKDGSVFIGVTTDNFIKNKGEIKSYDLRVKQLEDFLGKNGFLQKSIIKPINDKFGPTIHKDFDAIVVSIETKNNAEEINKLRQKNGKNQLKIIIIPLIVADDGKKISSSRIRAGEIDNEGHLV